MTLKELANKSELNILVEGNADTEITGIYCCDLLSIVMSKAPEGCAWVTIMNNINSVAVASLRDIGCIVLAGDIPADSVLLTKATEEGINVLSSAKPIFETALGIYKAMES